MFVANCRSKDRGKYLAKGLLTEFRTLRFERDSKLDTPIVNHADFCRRRYVKLVVGAIEEVMLQLNDEEIEMMHAVYFDDNKRLTIEALSEKFYCYKDKIVKFKRKVLALLMVELGF